MRVQQVAHLRQSLPLHRQLPAKQLALDPAVRQHGHGDEAVIVHGNEVEPLHRHRLRVVRHGIGGVAHHAGDHLARLGHHLIHLRHLPGEGAADALGLRLRQRTALHELVDIEPIALGGGNPAGGGVGLLQIAHLHQIRQLVADGGGADPAGHLLGNGLGAHRLRRGHIAVHHDL